MINSKENLFLDIDNIVMESNGMHFEFDIRNKCVRYRNVISPRDGGMCFPDGYFDEKKASIPQRTMDQIVVALDRFLLNQTLSTELDVLPPGAGYHAYMKITFFNKTVYYTDAHTTEDGFQVKYDPVDEDFIQIIRLLKQHCLPVRQQHKRK